MAGRRHRHPRRAESWTWDGCRQATAARVIDAHGLTVSPGFIDVALARVEGLAGALKDARQLLAQGITTVAVNPDGGGPIDLRAQRAGFEQRGIGVNVALYVPHGSIRREVIGMADRAPTPSELERMASSRAAAWRPAASACRPGCITRPAATRRPKKSSRSRKIVGEIGGVYESHIRDEADYSIGVVAAVQEVIRISEEGHIPGIVAT